MVYVKTSGCNAAANGLAVEAARRVLLRLVDLDLERTGELIATAPVGKAAAVFRKENLDTAGAPSWVVVAGGTAAE